MQIPMFAGAVAIIHSLPGGVVPPNQSLQLTAKIISQIYLAKIRKWNDPQLVEKNPWLANVSLDLFAYGRRDSSGASYELTKFLVNSPDGGPTEWTKGVSKFPAFPPCTWSILYY